MSQDVRLAWVNYDREYILFLCLGDEEGKTYGLRADVLSDHEISAIKSRLPQLNSVSLGRRIQWVKENLPGAYGKSFRSLKVSKSRKVNEWQI